MRPRLRFEPFAREGVAFADVALVVDVIRATTTAVAFFEAGAEELWFAPDHTAALALKGEGFLVAGETKGLKPPGFDLGNSPREALAAPVSGKRVVMSTTNGTRAAGLAAKTARYMALASLWNRCAVATWAKKTAKEEVSVLAAGKEGGFGLDDAYTAGAVLAYLEGNPDDGAQAALALFAHYPNPHAPLEASAAAQALFAVGLGADVEAVAELEKSQVVPVLDRIEGPYLVFRRSDA